MKKSKSEIVDIVDPQNQIIAQVEKTEAHARRLLHRAIISEVINAKGEWLLVQQATDRQDAGQYVSPVGGHIRADEDELSALKREADEELGITMPRQKYVGKAIFDRKVLDRHENHYFILYEIFSSSVPVLNHEAVSYRRFGQKEMTQLLRENPSMFGDAFHFVVKTFYPQLLK